MAAPSHAFILAGGRGTRFWPLSRHANPKQLLDFTGEGSLLSLTLDRIEPLIPASRQWVITSDDLAPAVAQMLPDIPRDHIIAEPVGRNTAPAVALAAALLEREDPEATFAVLPSDHLISPAKVFRSSLQQALELAAAEDVLITFGMKATRPETGYGYIEAAEDLNGGARRVAAFCEKPDRETAQTYVDSRRHYWNSGMFAWRASVVLAGLERHLSDVVAPCREAAKQLGTSGFASALELAYGQVPSISIDYGLMERADNVVVLPATFDWNDVGHWVAMRDLWPRDAQGNAAHGEILAVDSAENIVYGPGRLTALVGVRDLVVVHTEDATLVCSAEHAQEVRGVLDRLKERGLTQYL